MKRFVKYIFLFFHQGNFYQKLRNSYYAFQVKKKVDHLKKTGKLLPPYDITLETNLTCNLRCYFCYQREIHTIKQNNLTPDEIRSFFLHIPSADIREINLIGGEIFIRHDIFKIFDVFEELKIPFSMVTNGTMLNKEKINMLLRYKYLKKIIFSIHGTEDIHDEIVGAKGAYKRASEAIKLLAHKRIWLGIIAVVTEKNYKAIKNIIDLAKELCVDELTLGMEFSLGIFDYLKQKGKNTEQIKSNDYKIFEKHTQKMRALIMDTIRDAQRYASQKKVLLGFYTNIMHDHLELFIKKKVLENRNSINLFCTDLFKIRFDPEGRLVFCFLARNTYGRLRSASFEDLINGAEISAIRKRIANRKFIPICEGCCRLEKI